MELPPENKAGNPPHRRLHNASLALFLAAVLITLSTPAYAQNCGAAGKEVRSVQSDAFDDFPALNDMKQGILLMLYGRGSADCPEELYTFAMEGKDFINTFDEAYLLSLSNSTEDRVSSLTLAKALKDKAASMRQHENLGASATDVAASARDAVIDFLKTQGQINDRDGGLANRTRDKIAHYRLATIAYETADENILATNTKLKWETLREEYTRDMEQADGLFSQAEVLMEDSQKLSGSIPTKIKAYVDSMEALELYKSALFYYVLHNEDEKIMETQDRIVIAESTMATLRSSLILYFTVLAVALIVIALYLLNRLLAWREDTHEYYLGNELIKVRGVE